MFGCPLRRRQQQWRNCFGPPLGPVRLLTHVHTSCHTSCHRMTPRDFELPGLASTLSSLERLGALSPPLLDTATRHLMASGLGPAPVQEGFPQPPSPHPRALQQGALRVLRLLCKQRR